jgi:hypothetical protein
MQFAGIRFELFFKPSWIMCFIIAGILDRLTVHAAELRGGYSRYKKSTRTPEIRQNI